MKTLMLLSMTLLFSSSSFAQDYDLPPDFDPPPTSQQQQKWLPANPENPLPLPEYDELPDYQWGETPKYTPNPDADPNRPWGNTRTVCLITFTNVGFKILFDGAVLIEGPIQDLNTAKVALQASGTCTEFIEN